MSSLVHAIVILAAGALCAALAAAAAAVLLPVLRAKWRAAGGGARALFAIAAAAATYYGGSKSIGRVSYPATDSGTAYLTDNGSSVTNDAVTLDFTRSSLVPDDAWLFLDACPLSVTNAADVAANCVTVYSNQFSAISLPLTVAYENATNYQWFAYTDWTPGPVVHTNSVVNVAWLKAKGEMPPNAVRVVPLRTDLNVVNAETPEERAYRIYAPCTAFEVAVTNGTTVAFRVTLLSGHSSVTVDWGDGEASEYTAYGTASHAYAADGSFVVKISDDISRFDFEASNSAYDASRIYVTALFRWGDGIDYAGWLFKGCKNLAGFVPRWNENISDARYCYHGCAKLTGGVPEWNDKIWIPNSCYQYCSGLTGRVPAWNDKTTNAGSTFFGTGLTGEIPAWGPNITDANNCYRYCRGLTGAWTDDPAELMPTKITSHNDCVDGTPGLSKLFYKSWGGSVDDPVTE